MLRCLEEWTVETGVLTTSIRLCVRLRALRTGMALNVLGILREAIPVFCCVARRFPVSFPYTPVDRHRKLGSVSQAFLAGCEYFQLSEVVDKPIKIDGFEHFVLDVSEDVL